MPNRAKAFTLIELLLVISIISILSSIVMASLNQARGRARDAQRLSDVRQLRNALEMYFGKYEGYPGATSSLQSSGFVPKFPVPPIGAGQTQYSYGAFGQTAACSKGMIYHLGVALEDASNEALRTDRDAVQGGSAGYTNLCTGGVSFNGNASACTGVTAVIPDPCYDVTQ